MSDEKEGASSAPSGEVLLSDETVNVLLAAGKRRGWTGDTPEQVARKLAGETILRDAIEKRESPGDALESAKSPGLPGRR